jgi:hypothetical protein
MRPASLRRNWPYLAVIGLCACAGMPQSTSKAANERDFDAFSVASDLLPGRFANIAQVAAAGEAGTRQPAVGFPYEWVDVQAAQFWRIDAPALGEDVYYLEWRKSGFDGEISRQRIWAFRKDAAGDTRMDFYTFKDPAPFAGPGDTAGAFESLTTDALIGYGPDCSLVTEVTPDSLTATIPNTCQITARSGRKMTLSARFSVTPFGLTYTEAGVLDGGDIAFKVPGVEAGYIFDRLVE